MEEERREYIEDGKLVSEIKGWYQMVTKDKEGEAHVHTLHKHSKKVRPLPEPVSEEMFTRQAPPTTIRPTRRTRPTSDFETTLFLGDTHFPYQDKRAINLANIAIRELMPSTVVHLGDDLDMSLFSKYEQRSEWAGDTQRGIDELHAQLAQERADIGKDGKIIVHEGNHNQRLEKRLREYNAELIGLKRAQAGEELGVLTMSFLLRLNELGVEYISGYPNAEYWHEPHLKSIHGRVTNPSGKAAHIAVGKEDVSTVFGHDHGMNLAYRTIPTQDGHRQIFAMNVGTLAKIDGTTPSGRYSTTESGLTVPRAHNWQQAVGVVLHNEQEAIPYLLPITESGINILGKTYAS